MRDVDGTSRMDTCRGHSGVQFEQRQICQNIDEKVVVTELKNGGVEQFT